jgi:drug/metabolite transporter (DMT)-like permease
MHKKGLILVFSTAVISGFSIFINKYGVSVINPYIFTFLKNIMVALMLGGFILLLKDWKLFSGLTKKQWLQLFLIGLVGGSVPFLLFFKGLSLASAAQGAFIHKTMFVYAAILAAIFLKEKISKEFLIGALLLLLGSLIVLKTLPASFGKGDLFVLLATILWAVENLISKRALKELPARIVAWGRMSFGSFFVLIYLVLTSQIGLIGNLGSTQIVWTLITSVLLFSYVYTWYSGLKHVPLSAATAILIVGSPITTMLSLLSFNQISAREIISGILILTGAIFVIGFKSLWQKSKAITQAQLQA